MTHDHASPSELGGLVVSIADEVGSGGSDTDGGGHGSALVGAPDA